MYDEKKKWDRKKYWIMYETYELYLCATEDLCICGMERDVGKIQH